MEVGIGRWGRELQWWSHPLCTAQQWHLISRADNTSSRKTSTLRAPLWCPPSCLCTANSGPLPRSALLTLHFSSQPLPASVASCFGLGFPGLIPQGALVWAICTGTVGSKLVLVVAAFRTLEPVQAEEALAWGMGESAQMGTSPKAGARRWEGGPAGGEGVAVVSLPLVSHSVVAPCIYSALDFLWNFPGCEVPNLSPFWLSLCSQQCSSPCIQSPNPTFQHPAPVCSRRHTAQAGVYRAAAHTVCTVLPWFCPPQTGCCVSLWSAEGPLMPPADFPARNGLFWVQEPLFTFSPPSEVLVPSHFLFSFSFFHPNWLHR